MDIKSELNKVKKSAVELISLSEEKRKEVLMKFADALLSNLDELLIANRSDLEKMDKTDSRYDRLMLNEDRVGAIAESIKMVSGFKSPLNVVLDERVIHEKMQLSKVSVPLGVVGVIYEARPNVTCDIFSMCFKSGNACVLKGGSDAEYSNKSIVSIIKGVLRDCKVSEDVVLLLPNDRSVVDQIFKANDYIDVLIPRGSRSLIDYVRDNARVPVIETGAGVVHIYFDEYGDVSKAKNIILNAKTNRTGVCNALDTLILHKDRIADLAELVQPLGDKEVSLYVDELAYEALKGKYDLLNVASEGDFGREYLGLAMSIKVVDTFESALKHIYKYSSKHTEVIISDNQQVVDEFLRKVDAGCVFSNCSTRFSDGGEFGLGAEVGISTQKLHARGPMGIEVLTTYKWILSGNGEVRN